MTSRRWAFVILVGASAACFSFVVGSCLGLYLSGSLPESLPVSWPPVLVRTLPSPSPGDLPSPQSSATGTPAPSLSPTQTPPTPTSTWVVPPLPSVLVPPRQPASPDEWEPDDTPAQAQPIEVAVWQEHNLHVLGDQDWLHFEAQPGQTYEVQTSDLGREVDTVVSLYDGEGNELAWDDDGGDEFRSSRLFWSPQEEVRLYVMVRGFGDTQGGPDTQYRVSMRLAEGFQVDEHEPDDSPEQATRIEVGETQRHNRHVSADEDWVSIRAEAGQTYVIETSRLGQRADTVIYLYDRERNELAVDDDGGEEERASRLEWTAPNAGLFFVKVQNWLPTLAGPGTGYDLMLSVVGED